MAVQETILTGTIPAIDGKELNNMTLIELQSILGERIKVATDESISAEDMVGENEKSDIIARLAKQMINNADIVLRTDKLRAEGKLCKSAISKIVGE